MIVYVKEGKHLINITNCHVVTIEDRTGSLMYECSVLARSVGSGDTQTLYNGTEAECDDYVAALVKGLTVAVTGQVRIVVILPGVPEGTPRDTGEEEGTPEIPGEEEAVQDEFPF